jgi:hypothetical protein
MSKSAPKKYSQKVKQTVHDLNERSVPHQRIYRFVVVRPGDSNNERDR